MQKKPRINPEFKDLIPPLSTEEYGQLEQNILAHGCRDPIILWRDTIVDGHNRYEICTKHGLKYETIKIRLSSKEAAKLWILENQLGRRNISNAMRIELAARKIEQMGLKTYVNKNIADASGLNEKKVQRYMQIKSTGGPELLEKVLSGEVKIGTAHRQVEVITKTVEEIPAGPMKDEDRIRYASRAIMSNIKLIENLYMFLLEHSPYCGDMPQDVITKLEAQCRRVQMVASKM